MLPTLLLTQAWFEQSADGRPIPGPARLEIWQQGEAGWSVTRIEDPDSNVFHEARFFADGILTIGGTGAFLKHWTLADGAWTAQTWLHRDFGGQFSRYRELEIGDVDHDGRDEIILATHDAGVITIFHPDTGEAVELPGQPDTFVHEIEIGDIDGDGRLEFFASTTHRAPADTSEVTMFRRDGETWQRTVVEAQTGARVRELLVTDLDGDGIDELLSVRDAAGEPVTIRRHTTDGAGWQSHALLTLDDQTARFLVAGDLDHDGDIDLAIGAMRSGLWWATRREGKWRPELIDADSGGFEHVVHPADLDGDGRLVLLVASDSERELKAYRYRDGVFQKTLIGRYDTSTISWSLDLGHF